MSDVQQGDDWWRASDGKWYPPERHPDYQPLLSPPPTPQPRQRTGPRPGLKERGYFDWRGRNFFPDPSGRNNYREVKRHGWTDLVSDGPGSKATEDAEGRELCVDVPTPTSIAARDAAAEAAKTLPPGTNPWQYKVVSATFGDSLESSLNEYGRYGWEVVSISAANGTLTITGNKIFALLKRPIPREGDDD